MKRATLADLMAAASADTIRANPGLALPTRLDSPRNAPGALAVSIPVRQTKRATGQKTAPFGRCPHTGRAYRSRTEARWAAEHTGQRFEALAIATPCGVYWPDFYADHRRWNAGSDRLYEVKGGHIRDRAMHKVKAAIRPAQALGFAGIWLAQWDGKRWTVTEVQEG